MHLTTTAVTFGLIFLGELPDKTAIASLVLGTRYPWRWVFLGVAAAFAVHVAIAVTAGSLLTLLPHRLVEGVVAVVFLLGAYVLWREGQEDEQELADAEAAELADAPAQAGPLRVAALSFGVIFVAEWGDITQIMTANLAAKYHQPLAVGLGATLGLWAVGLLAALGGTTVLRVLPMRAITRAAAVLMLGLAAYSAKVALLP